MTNFEYFRSSGLIPPLVPLYMGPCATQLFVRHKQGRQTCFHPHYLCRLGLAFNHARWLGSPAPWWFWVVWCDPHNLETGVVAVFAGLSGYLNFCSFSRESFGSYLLSSLRDRK